MRDSSARREGIGTDRPAGAAGSVALGAIKLNQIKSNGQIRGNNILTMWVSD